MQTMNGWMTQLMTWTGEALVSTAAGLLIALMLVPLTLFLGSCWVDQRFVEPRRQREGDDRPFDRHAAARQRARVQAAA